MKNKLFILLVSFWAIGFYACKEDEISATDMERNKSFMTMFRQQANTGNSSDPKACQVININDMYLTWYGIEGAAGYRIQMKLQTGSWDTPMLDTIVGPDVLKLTIEDLQYSTRHSFAIKTLSAIGPEYDSEWYGYGDSGHNDERCEYIMGDRVAVPDVIAVQSVTESSMRIVFDLNYVNSDPSFEHENGSFLMDEITVAPSATNGNLPSQRFTLTQADIDRGYIDVEGLTSNAVYVVNGLNNRIKRYWDRLYNTTMVRMKGEVGEPILIPHIVDVSEEWGALAATHNASRLDTILNQYMSDNTLAEGTILLLEGGKTYFIQNTVNISKGLTLKSNDPNKRAIVLMGIGLNESGGANAYNLSFGRNPEPGEMGGINIQSIIIEDINFDAPYAMKYVQNNTTGTGNYFINQSSGAMPFSCSSFEIRNCDFSRMTRGWVRIQGPNRKIIERWIIDNCLWYNSGVYDNNGRGYAYIDGDRTNPNSNIFNNLSITNSSFIDSPNDHLFSEGTNLAWGANVKWNITLENCTFLNWSTRSSGRLLFNMRYNPSNSTFTVRKNLFIQTKSEGDSRDLHNNAMNIRNFNGVVFDIADNYSTNTNLTNGQIFTANGFNSASQGAGYQNGALNKGGLEATQVKLGAVGISPTDLMVDPNPIAVSGPNMHMHNMEGLYYKNTAAVRNHEIYRLGIGDPRWSKTVTP